MQTAYSFSMPPVTFPEERLTPSSHPIAQGLHCAAHQGSYTSSTDWWAFPVLWAALAYAQDSVLFP